MAIVYKWVNENVPQHLRKKFRKHMVRWDQSLKGLDIGYWPTYDEDVLLTALKYAEEEI